MLDLVILGAGLAGLSCAARAAELGVQVRIFEKGKQERYPCNSRYAEGALHLDGLSVDSPVEELVQLLVARCPDDVSKVAIDGWARNAHRAVRWLKVYGGARFVRVGSDPHNHSMLAPPRAPKPGLAALGHGSDHVLNTLAAFVRRRGMPIQRAALVLDVTEHAEGYAVSVLQDGVITDTITRAVVFADGGFQSNEALIGKHITRSAPKLAQRNSGTGMGSCLEIAVRLGASINGLQSFYGHLLSRDALTKDALCADPIIDRLAEAGVVVGPHGRRFADEGRGGVYLANQVARRSDPKDATVVFDDRTWWSVGRQSRVPPNPVLDQRGGQHWTSDSIEDLASQAGIDPVVLAQTVEAHNEFVHTGQHLPPDPPRSPGTRTTPLILSAPFHAVPVCAGITNTTGGIVVTEKAEVCSGEGEPIRGLYAAGATVSSVGDGAQPYHLGPLTAALVLGVLSAENAVLWLRNRYPLPA